MGFQLGSLDRKTAGDRRAIRKRADALKTELTQRTYLGPHDS